MRGFWGGGTAGGLGPSAGGGALLGRRRGGWLGLGGFNPQLESKLSSSAHSSHPNSPRLTHHGVIAAHVSVRWQERSHSRSPDTMAHPRWGLSNSSCYRADRAMLNSAAPNLYRMWTAATSAGFTSMSKTCESAIHKCVHKTRE